MKFKTWLERVESLDVNESMLMSEALLKEAPHTSFSGKLPAELSFLDGRYVDLGFENLGFDKENQKKILRAFSGNGVAVPQTKFKLRFAYPNAVVEFQDGSEQETLPDYWKEAVLVANDEVIPTWVGKRVRPDQIEGFDLKGYKDNGEALIPFDVKIAG